MSLSAQFKTDETKESNGVPIRLAPNDDGSVPTFYVSRMGKTNKDYMKALERAIRPVQTRIDRKTLPREESEAILLDVFVKHVLKNWENVELADVTGNADDKGFAPYNPANAKKLFDRLPDLYDDLTQQANEAANFRDAELEDSAKNS